MKRIHIFRTFAAALCIGLIISCAAEQPLVMPNPGFGITATGEERSGRGFFLPFARTSGQLATTPFTGQVIIPTGATGSTPTFDVTANSRGRAVVPDGVAPAFWSVQAISGWNFIDPGGVFSSAQPVICNGMRTGAVMNRAEFNIFVCRLLSFAGPLPFPFSSINVSEAPIEFQMAAADRVTSTYGMPTFQFFDVYGTYVAQTTATEIDTENSIWAKGWTHCLAGLPAGNYSIDLINATSDGVGERVGAANVYLYGASSANYIDDHQYFVAQQYRDFLNREPDWGGLNFWTGQITQCSNATFRQPNETYAQCVVRKRVDVSLAFWGSGEFSQLHPEVINPSGSPAYNNSEFVRLSHVLYLRREPTQTDQDFWMAHLTETNQYGGVIKGFINSDEYRLRFEPPPPPICDPTWEELNSCQQQGGWWDYNGCWCNWGGGGVMY